MERRQKGGWQGTQKRLNYRTRGSEKRGKGDEKKRSWNKKDRVKKKKVEI